MSELDMDVGPAPPAPTPHRGPRVVAAAPRQRVRGAPTPSQGGRSARDRPAPDRPAPDRLAFGGLGPQTTELDEAEVAQAQLAPPPRETEAPGMPDPATPAATPAATTGPEPDAVGGETAPSHRVPSDIDTPEALVSAAHGATAAIASRAPESAPLSVVLDPVVSHARTRRPAAPTRGVGLRPPPIEAIAIDPVPEATKAITAALEERLPPLRLPPLAVPPAPIPVPRLDPTMVPQTAVAELDRPAPEQPTVTGRHVSDAERARRARAVARASEPVSVAPEPLAAFDPPVLLEVRQQPAPPLPPAAAELQKGQVLKVLASVGAAIPQEATRTEQAIRDAAFDEGRMADHFTQLTVAMRPGIEQDLQTALHALADAAGVVAQDLASAVVARQQEIEAGVARQVSEADLSVEGAAHALTREARREKARIATEERRREARRVQRLRLAQHSHDPTLVDELVTQRLDCLAKDVSQGVVAIDASGARRKDLLAGYDRAYADAYRRADDADQARIARERTEAAARSPGAAPPEPSSAPEEDWATTAQENTHAAFTELVTATTDATQTLVTHLTDAAAAARAALRSWRETRLRRVQHTENTRLAATTDAEAVAATVAKARAQVETDGARQRLVREIGFVSEAYRQKQEQLAGATIDADRALDEQAMAVADTYLAAAPGDPFTAVAEAVAGREREKVVAARAPELRATILAMTPTSRDEAEELGDIYFPQGGAGLIARSRALRRAFDGPGTDEDAVYAQLSGISGAPMKLLNATYALLYDGEGLQSRIRDEMSGSEKDKALGLAGDDGSATAAQARQRYARGVIAESHGFFTNDPQAALDAIRAMPPGEADAVVEDPDTRRHLTAVLGGARWDPSKRAHVTDQRGEDELAVLLQINAMTREPGEPRSPELRRAQARADALEMDRYVRPGTNLTRSDLDKLFARIRADVLRDPATATWSAEEVDFEVRRRTRDMEHAYQVEFGHELPGGPNALRTAIGRYLWGTTRQLATDLLDVNRAGERATRLQKTTEGFYTSDSEMNAELARTYNDALAEVRRNRSYQERVQTRTTELLREHGHAPGTPPPDPATVAAYRREATEEIARGLAQTWFAQVTTTFGTRYAHLWGGGTQGALRAMVTDTTQWGGEDEALDRLAGGGGLTAAESTYHGLGGWGMDKDMVMAGIGGRTKEQLDRISAEFREVSMRHSSGGPLAALEEHDMEKRLQSETGDWSWSEKDTSLERDAFDVREALRGIPTTPEEQLAAADRRFAYDSAVYFADDPTTRDMVVGDELDDLRRAHDHARAAYQRYATARASGDPTAIGRAESAMRVGFEGVDVAADSYREAVDAYVEKAAQIAAIAAAVVITIATWGVAGPVVIALAASVAGTVASMATKQSVLGSAYSRHALTNDAIVGVVDAVVSVLTARLGNILLRLPKPTGTGQILKASIATIEAQRLAKPVLARVGAFAAEQVAQAAPSATTAALLDRSTWKGDPVKNVAKAAGFASAVGIGIGSVMHGVSNHGPKVFGTALDAIRAMRSGSGADITAERVLLRSTTESLARGGEADVLARRGTPVERLAAQREYLRRFPDRTPADFRAAVEAGTADAVASAEARRMLRREMLTELLDGVPPAERGRFLDTPILVLSDAEFVASTGSRSKGNAATLILHGEPVVVIRENAALSALREEGMHVRQIRDVANAERVARLDEERLAAWGSASLEERAAAWHAKLDLELEVQARTIAELDERLARPGATAERAAIWAEQLEDARAAYEVLSHRRRQLLDLDEAAMARIRSGNDRAPGFLAEEPRLFSKKATPKGPAPPQADLPPGWFEDPAQPGVYMTEPETTVLYGTPWRDPEDRMRRWVRQWDPESRSFRTFEQVKKDGGPWRLHGDVPRWTGLVGETAMKAEHTRLARGEAAGLSGADDVHRVQIDAQRDNGTGFDDVVPEFRTRPDGTVDAVIVIDEAKYYRGRAGSFTAIGPQFPENLALLRQRLERLRDEGAWEAAGMTRAQLEAALTAVDSGEIRIVVRTAERTALTDAALGKLQTSLRRRPGLGKRVSVVRGEHIGAAGIEAAEDLVGRLERYRLGGYPELSEADVDLVRRLAARPNGVTKRSLDTAEAVVEARMRHGAIGRGEVTWGPTGDYLLDDVGPFEVVQPRRTGDGRFDPAAAARGVLDRADATVTPPGASEPSPMRILVDCSELNAGEAELLELELGRLGRDGRQGALDRTETVLVRRAAGPVGRSR